MKKNKLILFDWGNIVESHKTGYTLFNAYDDLFKEIGYNGNDIFNDLGKYHLTTVSSINKFKEIFNQVIIDLNLKCTFYEFLEIYNKYCNKITYYKDVRDYEISLKERCYIGIFSNLYLIDKDRLDMQVGIHNFDYKFLSFELESKKPDIDVFRKVNDKLPFDSKDILFIDDRKDNVESAKKVGWNALEVTGLELEKIKLECEKFLNE